MAIASSGKTPASPSTAANSSPCLDRTEGASPPCSVCSSACCRRPRATSRCSDAVRVAGIRRSATSRSAVISTLTFQSAAATSSTWASTGASGAWRSAGVWSMPVSGSTARWTRCRLAPMPTARSAGSTTRQSRCCRTATATCSLSDWRPRALITMPDLSIVGMLSHTAAPYFGWDLVRDVQELLRYAFMQHAFEAGTVVALTAGVIGYFVVLRGLSFAAHGLSHIGFAGATGAVLLGLAPIVGLLAFTMSAGAPLGALGQRLRGRDVTIGLVMAWSLGLGLLFTALYKGSASRAIGILFGQVFGITGQEVAVTSAAAIITLLALVIAYRPLLFTTLDEQVAEAKGVPVHGLSIAFMVILAVAVSEAVQVVGVLLIFALIVAPAALAERVTGRPIPGIPVP